MEQHTGPAAMSFGYAEGRLSQLMGSQPQLFRPRVCLFRVGCLLLRARPVARRALRHRVEQLLIL